MGGKADAVVHVRVGEKEMKTKVREKLCQGQKKEMKMKVREKICQGQGEGDENEDER